MVRKFWLINGNGETYKLTNADLHINLYAPTGLGFQKEIRTIRLGNVAKKISEQYMLPIINGIISFGNKTNIAYEEYNEFVYFISKQPLKLYYQTPNTIDNYYVDGDFVLLEKGEVNQYGNLDCNVTFNGFSHWKNGKVNTQFFERGDYSNGKSYPLVRPYSYSGYGFIDMPINNNNTCDSAFTFEIIGYIENPILSFYQNNNRYGVIALKGEFDYVKVVTSEDKEEIYLERNGLPLSNPINYQDIDYDYNGSTMTFFRIKSGQNTLTFVAENENEFNGQLKMTWEDEFISV